MKYATIAGALAAVSMQALLAGQAHAQETDAAQTASDDTQPAEADSDEPMRGVIVVTAQRREQALQDTPLAVTAVTADALRDKNIAALSDIPNGSVPGINIANNAGSPSILQISARGVATSDPSQGTQELPVPLYIDGVPLGRGQGLGLELIDPERVEFLRGPQGQLFGRNAEGGAIQFVSRRPTGEFGFDASMQLGNYDLMRERLKVDLPEIGNFRIQGSMVHTFHDAYTKNKPKGVYSDQADFGGAESFGYRLAVEWNPTASLRLNYAYDNSKITDQQPYLLWTPVDTLAPPFSPQPASVPGDVDYPKVSDDAIYNEDFKTYARGHGLTIEYLASDAITLKSISSYRESGRHGSSTLSPALPVGISSSGYLLTNAREDISQDQYYQELQGFLDAGNFNLTVGATYFKEEVVDQRRSYITGPGLDGPVTYIIPESLAGCVGLEKCMTAHSEQNAESNSYGVYAQATWVPPILDEKLELTAGIRYSDDKKVANRTYIQPFLLPPYTENSPSGPLPSQSVFKEKRWDPAFTVKYNFTDEVNAYVRYATAYRAGGVNVRSSSFVPYDQEEIEAIEVGMKSRLLNNSLIFNVAYYHNTISDFQFTIQEAPTENPALTNTLNSPNDVKIQGVEVEATLFATDNLTLAAGYSYMDAKKYREFDNPLTEEVDINRFYSIFTPKHTANIAADYVTPEYGFGKFALHADYAFASGHWATPGPIAVDILGPNYKRPQAKTRQLNARIALQDIPMGPMKGEIAAFGKNILGDTHYNFGFDGAAFGGGFAYYIPEPARFGVEFRVQY